MSTETVKACPQGHLAIRKRVGITRPKGWAQNKHERIAKSEYYCKTCSRLNHLYDSPHYERQDLIEKERRVNDQLEYDIKLGYVWSPSHDE